MLTLHGKVDLDGSGWESGLRRLEHATERTKEHIAGTVKGLAMEAFGIYGIEQAIQKTIEYGSKIVDTARRVGIGVEALQEFTFAAKMNGVEIDTLTGFIERLNSTRIDPKKFASFQKLGISSGDLQSLKVEDIMMKISASVNNKSPQEIIAPLRDIGGRGAGALIPMLTDNLAELRENAKKFGLVMSGDVSVKLKAMADSFKILSDLILNLLGPAIVKVGEWAYKTALKGSGEVAGRAAFWGSATAKMGPMEIIEAIPKTVGAVLGGLIAGDPGSMVDKLGKIYDFSNASKAMDDAKQPWAEMIKSFDKAFENLRKRTTDFPDPEFAFTGGKTPQHKAKEATDSLVKVGNFLGGSRDIIADIARAQLVALQQIARNTSSGNSLSGADMGIPLV